jgi:hypothetical protein
MDLISSVLISNQYTGKSWTTLIYCIPSTERFNFVSVEDISGRENNEKCVLLEDNLYSIVCVYQLHLNAGQNAVFQPFHFISDVKHEKISKLPCTNYHSNIQYTQ